MIQITHPNINDLVDEHYDAVIEYYKRDNKKTPISDHKDINDWLLKPDHLRKYIHRRHSHP